MDQLAVVPAYSHPELAVNECAYSQSTPPRSAGIHLSNPGTAAPAWMAGTQVDYLDTAEAQEILALLMLIHHWRRPTVDMPAVD